MDDRQLLREYVAHQSEAAFNELVRRHMALVYSAALRQLRDPHLAQEVTQAVFLILARKAKNLSQEAVLSGWLYRTTRFAVLDLRKAEARRQRREQEALLMQTTLQEGSANPFWEQIWPILDEAMLQLSEKDRRALVLRFFEGKELRAVGQVLGINEDAAQKRVGRALERLRGCLAKSGVAAATPALAAALTSQAAPAAPPALEAAVRGAVALNAAASSSTAALVQGTLKMMALAKLQAAALLSLGAAVAGVTTLIVLPRIAPTARHGLTQTTAPSAATLTQDAAAFLTTLKDQDRLPGFGRSERGTLRSQEALASEAGTALYPASRTLHAQKEGMPFEYLYELRKGSPREPWRLVRAWRSDSAGKLLETFPVN